LAETGIETGLVLSPQLKRYIAAVHEFVEFTVATTFTVSGAFPDIGETWI
jgi:hypothetical protein